MGETKGRKWTIRHIGDAYSLKHLEPTFRFQRKTILVWGAVALDKKYPLKYCQYSYTEPTGKVVETKGLGSKGYVKQILEGHMQPLLDDMRREERGKVLVLEDGAPAHTAKSTQATRSRLGIHPLPHPPNSPDLNPIENVWLMLKQHVQEIRPRATNPDMLWEHILIAWRKIEQRHINSCVESMPARREAVILAEGKQTKW